MFDRIVQFADGTYGVKRGIIFTEYLDNSPRNHFWWTTPEYVRKYCKFGTIEGAKKKYQDTLNKEKILEWL